MGVSDLRRRIDAELQSAWQARAQGNEGRARVCARRAAGAALAAYYAGRDGPPASANAYQLLRRVQKTPAIRSEIGQAARRLTVRVDASHRLPHMQDPLEDAVSLVNAVLAWID
jgi:hypothetical protein